jgi:hypothetical protein
MPLSLSWTTPAGIIGVYPATVAMQYYLQATVTGGTIVDYKIISGSLPDGLSFFPNGKIYGTPNIVNDSLTNTFVVRVTATDGTNTVIQDRTFGLTVTYNVSPAFTLPNDTTIINTEDSVWIEQAVTYNNPLPDNLVSMRVLQGILPPGLEINEFGLIRGYANPPVIEANLSQVTTTASSTSSINNYIILLSTFGIVPGRTIIFTGSTFGNIVSGTIYYVKEVIDNTNITITTIPDGSVFILSNGSGTMTVTLPQLVVGEPTKRQYNFTLELSSSNGLDTANYNIIVINQNLPVNQGGPNKVFGSRIPTIYNTRPPTYDIVEDIDNYGYYVLPPADTVSIPGTTYLPSQEAYMGEFSNNNFFSFHILGHDFDNIPLTYTFSVLPGWLSVNTSTGWLYGTPNITANTVEFLSFDVKVSKVVGVSTVESPWFNFNYKIYSDITGNITWLSTNNLGTFYNSTICMTDIMATTDVDLEYTIESGNLPPNITLNDNGELQGIFSYQPANNYSELSTINTFTFTVNAHAANNSLANVIYDTKTFTMSVKQEFEQPTDNLYITCTPNKEDRYIIDSLLNDTMLIPDNYLYRITDDNFGKAKSVVYAHAYGIESSNINEYIEAVQKNHYDRAVILGSLSTAVAKNENGEVVYEVVYCNIIDNLMKYDPNYNLDYRYATSISEEIFWPRFIPLNLGPWYTSQTDIYTSYIYANEAYMIANFTLYDLLSQVTQTFLLNQGIPTYYTSLTPGYARILYPNSLKNMRDRVEQELGVDDDFRKLPLWMTSQQNDGNTLGYTPAWVICYTKPGYAETIKNNIENDWTYKLNMIDFKMDRFTVDKQITYDYDAYANIDSWTAFPSATPIPNPTDSENFYVLFPRTTILPNEPQYNL